MKDYPYVIWLLAIWMCLTLNQCQQNSYNRDILSELKEIKREVKSQ